MGQGERGEGGVRGHVSADDGFSLLIDACIRIHPGPPEPHRAGEARCQRGPRGAYEAGVYNDIQTPHKPTINTYDTYTRQFGGFAGDQGDGFADQAVDPRAMTTGIIPLLTDAQWLLVGTLPMASGLSGST